MLKTIKIKLQYLLPKQGLTRLAGWAADKQAGWLTTLVIKAFIKSYNVNMQEAERSEPDDYKTFNEFFVRPLKEGARPILSDKHTLVLPADGTVSQLGTIEQGKLLQAKGHDYTLDALLACDKQMVSLFQNGQFATIYLSPRDYHRVHMPCDGVLREMLYVPGELFSVNFLTAENVPNLFARNERLICLFDTPFGPMVQILVGATIVGSIETVWAGTVTPPRTGIIQRWEYPAVGKNSIKLAKGDEMGRFKLGSTVINLFAANTVVLADRLQSKTPTLVGESFAISAQAAAQRAEPAEEAAEG